MQQKSEETQRKRNPIPTGSKSIGYRPLVWTADGRPHPAVTRTPQYAGDIASCRNGQQISAKAPKHRWKHDIQVTLLRRRIAMTRAVLPNKSAREQFCKPQPSTPQASSRSTRAPAVISNSPDGRARVGAGGFLRRQQRQTYSHKLSQSRVSGVNAARFSSSTHLHSLPPLSRLLPPSAVLVGRLDLLGTISEVSFIF